MTQGGITADRGRHKFSEVENRGKEDSLWPPNLFRLTFNLNRIAANTVNDEWKRHVI